MIRYIGTKILYAKPMTLAQYNAHRGWTMPIGEDGTDAGYLVEYQDGYISWTMPIGEDGTDAGYLVEYQDGYISWSPKAIFEESYRPCNAMTFGLAIDAMKQGHRVARAGWNGKGMWVTLVSPTPPSAMTLPFIAMKTADNNVVPWLASQTDMLAEDWSIV